MAPFLDLLVSLVQAIKLHLPKHIGTHELLFIYSTVYNRYDSTLIGTAEAAATIQLVHLAKQLQSPISRHQLCVKFGFLHLTHLLGGSPGGTVSGSHRGTIWEPIQPLTLNLKLLCMMKHHST